MKKLLVIVLVSIFWWQNPVSSQDYELSAKLSSHVEFLSSDSLEGRGLGTLGKEIAKNYIVRQFKEAGLKPLNKSYLQPFKFKRDLIWVDACNIVAYIEGSDPVLRDEFIVIGAHYDHLGYENRNSEKIIYPGADDNASGVASIIELGKYFSKNPSLLGRSLIIAAFDAEESGLIGSAEFVKNCPVDLSKIKIMFSFDMVGMYEANNGISMRGLGTLQDGLEMVTPLAQANEIIIKNTGNTVPGGTDTAPFGNKGIPSVHFFTGIKSPYHQPEDKSDLLDYDGMAKITEFSQDFISLLSKSTQLKPSLEIAQITDKSKKALQGRFSSGVVMNHGSGYHNYKHEFFRAKPVYNFSAGVFAQLGLNDFFRLEQSVLYDFNGSRIDGGTFRTHSLTLPLNFMIGTPRSFSNELHVYIFGGGFFKYNFSGRSAGKSIDYENEFEKTEWGYNFGSGFEIYQVQIGFTARRGLTDITRSESVTIFGNSNYFTLGYKF